MLVLCNFVIFCISFTNLPGAAWGAGGKYVDWGAGAGAIWMKKDEFVKKWCILKFSTNIPGAGAGWYTGAKWMQIKRIIINLCDLRFFTRTHKNFYECPSNTLTCRHLNILAHLLFIWDNSDDGNSMYCLVFFFAKLIHWYFAWESFWVCFMKFCFLFSF